MQKIISLFQRNYDTDHLVRDEVVPGAEWVLAGEGTPTVKIDGTCCAAHHGTLYKRHEVKQGKQAPEGFVPADDVDPKTGKQVGWVPVSDGPEDKWHREAWGANDAYEEGTYELIGPRIEGNPEGANRHMLVRHGHTAIHGAPRDFEGLRQFFQECNTEGIVWHHPDGRMVKIKAKDFGLPRGPGEPIGLPVEPQENPEEAAKVALVEMRVCRDCKHIQKDAEGCIKSYAACLHEKAEYKNLVTGATDRLQAHIMRGGRFPCGPDGKLFEASEA